MLKNKNLIVADRLQPLRDKVFVTDMEAGVRLTSGGIILPDDDMKESGVHPRWAKVYAVGPDVDDLKVGDWVLLAHGRWTNGIDMEIAGETVRVWHIDYPEGVILVSDEDPRLATVTF